MSLYKVKIMNLAKNFCKAGQHEEARILHHFINEKRMVLGISDAQWNVERALENKNIFPNGYTRSYGSVYILKDTEL